MTIVNCSNQHVSWTSRHDSPALPGSDSKVWRVRHLHLPSRLPTLMPTTTIFKLARMQHVRNLRSFAALAHMLCARN
eukprot:6380265-Alexandrium_andersonii.AAC.1